MNTHGDLTATRWLEHTVPVLLLLLLAHFASHAKAICVYAFFFVVLTRCDAYLRARVGKTKRGDDGGGADARGERRDGGRGGHGARTTRSARERVWLRTDDDGSTTSPAGRLELMRAIHAKKHSSVS